MGHNGVVSFKFAHASLRGGVGIDLEFPWIDLRSTTERRGGAKEQKKAKR
jgi:hypothetical protein